MEYARCTAGILARLLCESLVWLFLLAMLLREVRCLASAPEFALYGPPLSHQGEPAVVQLVVMRHATSQDNVLPCASLLAPNGVHDPLLTSRGVTEARAAVQALRRAGVRPDAVLASTLMRAQQTALLALALDGGCGGMKVHVVPHVAETHWGIVGSCRGNIDVGVRANTSTAAAARASSADYRCNVFHPASCNEEWPAVQREYLTIGKGGGSIFPHCEKGMGVGSECASWVSWDLVGGVEASYCSHADRWGQPNWPQFWSWLWQEERLWRRVAESGKEVPTIVLVTHGNMMKRLLGGHHPPNTGAYTQTVAFGSTPANGLLPFGSGGSGVNPVSPSSFTAPSEMAGWRCIHACTENT